MKKIKILGLIQLSVLICFLACIHISCGTGSLEKARTEKHKYDSIANMQKELATQDSLANAQNSGSDTIAKMPTIGNDTLPKTNNMPRKLLRPKPNSENIPQVNNNQKQAILGYSYFKKITREETRNINVNVLAINQNSKTDQLKVALVNDLKEINKQINAEKKYDTASYFTRDNIFFYKYLTISLKDPANSFKIVSLHENDRQLIDTLNLNKWQWAVTPTTDLKTATLNIVVYAESPDGTPKLIETRIIPVTIAIDNMSVWRVIWLWLYDHPESFLTLIIIPLIIYFGKKLIERKKKRNANDET